MKKIFLYGGLALFVLICSIITFKFLKNENENSLTTLKVAEVTHSAFYTPFYVAIENGYFNELGLDVELILTSGANNVAAAVLSGDVQIGLCGPEATIYIYNEKNKDYIQSFAGLTKRDGQFIVSRTKIDNFTLDNLKGKEILAGRVGGMPILNFMTALKIAGTKNVIVNDSVDFANLTSAFISGEGDFVNLFDLNVIKMMHYMKI